MLLILLVNYKNEKGCFLPEKQKTTSLSEYSLENDYPKIKFSLLEWLNFS